MAFLGRIIVIVFAVLMASLAAAMVGASAFFAPQWHDYLGQPGERFFFWSAVVLGTGLIGAFSTLPLAALITLAEALKIRSLLINTLGGVAVLLLGFYGGGFNRSYEESIDEAPPLISRELEITIAAGAVFGFVYWAVAGRNAGRWHERRRHSV